MFRNFSETLGAWSGWLVDQAAKEIIVRGGGETPRRQMERFATATDATAPCVVGTSPIDPTSASSFTNVVIKNADTGFYLGSNPQNRTTVATAPKYNLKMANSIYTLSDPSSPSTVYTIGQFGLDTRATLDSGDVYTNQLRINKNDDNTFNIQRGDVSGNAGYLIPVVNNSINQLSASSKISFRLIECGAKHTIAVGLDGLLYSWGENTKGQLGDGTIINKNRPVRVLGDLKNITYISCGDLSSFAIADGQLYAWGMNSEGQLGVGDSVDKSSPVLVRGTLTNITAVSCGNNITGIISNNRLYMCGRNATKALGVPSTDMKVTIPVAVYGWLLDANVNLISCNANGTCVAVSNGNLYGWGSDTSSVLKSADKSPTPIFRDLINITAMSLGNRHIIVLSDKQLYGWGDNTSGQLSGSTQPLVTNPTIMAGNFTTPSLIKCGRNNTLLIQGGMLYGWGENNDGQLGVSNYSITVGTATRSYSNIQNITYASVGEVHTSVLSNNAIYSCGGNYVSQFGDGTTIPSKTPKLMPFNGVSTPKEKSRWIFEQLDDPDKCKVRKLTVDKLMGAYIRCVLDSPLVNNYANIDIKINDKVMFTYRYNAANVISSIFKSFMIYDTSTGLTASYFMADIQKGFTQTADAKTAKLQDYTDMKIEIIQNNLVKASATYKNTTYSLPSDTFITSFRPTFDPTYCLSSSASSDSPTFSKCVLPNKNITFKLTLAPSSIGKFAIPNVDKLFALTDTAANKTYYLQVFQSLTPNVVSTAPVFTSTTKNYIVRIDKDAVGAYTFYFIPANAEPFTTNYIPLILNTTTSTNSAPINISGARIYFKVTSGVPIMYSSNTTPSIYNTTDSIYKFFLDDRCDTTSCSNKQSSLTASYLPWNSSTISECDNCTPTASYTPCSASGDCDTEKGRRTASKLKWSASDIPQCKACGSMMPTSYDPCNSASCTAAKRQAASSFQPYTESTFPECSDCPTDTGGLPGTYEPCSASGDCKTEQGKRTGSNIKWSSSDIPECKACGSMLPNSFDPCKSTECAAAKDALYKAFQPYNSASLAECQYCGSNTGSSPDSYNPCSASGVCATEKGRRTGSNIKWSSSDIPECKACGSMPPDSFDPCKSAECAAAKDALYKSKQPYNSASLSECQYCGSNTGSAPDSYDPCSASGDCETEQGRRTASNIKWSGSDIPACQACGSLKANSFDPCKSASCASKKKSLMDIFMPWKQAELTPECDHCPAGTGSLPDTYTPCGPNGQCDTVQKSRTASGISWTGAQIPECRNCGSDQTSASWSPPPPPPAPASASIAQAAPAPVTRTAKPLVYPVVYTDGRRITPTNAKEICKTVGGLTQSSVATNAQINTGTTSTRKWCHDTIDLTVAVGGTYNKTKSQDNQCGAAYKPVAKDSTGKPIYKDVMCFGNRLPIGTVVPSPAGNLRVSAMEGKDTFVGHKEAFTGSQYTPAMTPTRTMTSGGVSAGRIPLMPADMQGSTPTIGQGRSANAGYSTFTPRR